VRVNNVPPTINVPVGLMVDEGGTVTITFDDPGTLDTHVVMVDWGDGTVETIVLPLGARSVSHTYLDDDPSGTPQDVYTITMTVTDDDLGSDTQSFPVLVKNVAPFDISLELSESVINENDTVTLSGAFFDPGILDTHTVTIDWGDGSMPTVLNLPVVPGRASADPIAFMAVHQYLDDNPSGTPADVYTIVVTVIDDDTGEGVGMTTILVNNVAPSNVVFTLSATDIEEATTVFLAGSFDDPGTLDTHTVTIDWGDGSPPTMIALAPGARSFAASHFYADDNPTGTPMDINVVRVTVIDDDTGEGVGETEILVRNVPPTILTLTSTQLDTLGRTTVSGSFFDPGADSFTIVIDWADGTQDIIFNPPGVFTFTATHQYFGPPDPANPGADIPVTVTVIDDDTGADSLLTLVDVPGEVVVLGRVDTSPRIPTLTFPVSAPAPSLPPAPAITLATIPPAEERPPSVDTVAGEERKLVLRVVLPDGTECRADADSPPSELDDQLVGQVQCEVVLSEDVLDDLPALFGKLIDGHYRLYLVQDETERLVLDVHIRDGKPVGLDDQAQDTRDRPPMQEPPSLDNAPPTNDQPQLLEPPAADESALPQGAGAGSQGRWTAATAATRAAPREEIASGVAESVPPRTTMDGGCVPLAATVGNGDGQAPPQPGEAVGGQQAGWWLVPGGVAVAISSAAARRRRAEWELAQFARRPYVRAMRAGRPSGRSAAAASQVANA
jgi:hypothetical protein